MLDNRDDLLSEVIVRRLLVDLQPAGMGLQAGDTGVVGRVALTESLALSALQIEIGVF